MKRVFAWVIWLPVAVLVLGFVLANRQWVTLSLDPVNVAHPFFAMPMPLWGVFMVGLFIGIVVGWIGCWFKQGRHRRRARAEHAELERLRAQQSRPPEPPAEPPNPLIVSM